MRNTFKSIGYSALALLAICSSSITPVCAAQGFLLTTTTFKAAACGGQATFLRANNVEEQKQAISNNLYGFLSNPGFNEIAGMQAYFTYSRPVDGDFTAFEFAYRDQYNAAKFINVHLCFSDRKTGEHSAITKKLSDFKDVTPFAPFGIGVGLNGEKYTRTWKEGQIDAKALGIPKKNNLVLTKVGISLTSANQFKIGKCVPLYDEPLDWSNITIPDLSDRNKFNIIDMSAVDNCSELNSCPRQVSAN